MKTNTNIKSLRVSPKNEIVLIKGNTRNSSVLTLKPLRHDQFSILEEWKLSELMPPKYKESSAINQIIKEPLGDVTLRFAKRFSRCSKFVTIKDLSPRVSSKSKCFPRKSIDSTPTLDMDLESR